jgi:hypothetical protein
MSVLQLPHDWSLFETLALQAFVALESGEIQTYDLLCRRISAYVITNAWEVYERDLIASGMLVDTDATS